MARPTNTPVLHHSNLLFTLNSRPSHSLFYFGGSFRRQVHPLSSTYSNFFIQLPNKLNLQFRVSSTRNSITRVSTAPVEYASDLDLGDEIERLRLLVRTLASCEDLRERVRVIDLDGRVRAFFEFRKVDFGGVSLSEYEWFLIKCVVAAGQEHLFVGFESGDIMEKSAVKKAFCALAEMIEGWGEVGSDLKGLTKDESESLWSLLRMLDEVEKFYDCIGGIIGYQLSVLELLAESTHEERYANLSQQNKNHLRHQLVDIYPPPVLNLSEDAERASQAALWGIEGLPDLGEIYPLGGAADRLGLVDPETGECLPAAMLPYCGRTLLEGLIRDLQAREYLYYKLYGEQCITPVAIMTSAAKNNHGHINSLCERFRWFGRGRSSFQLFEQPLVPAIAADDGQWIVARQFVPVCKPGGHGVIWKLAHDKGVFKWFQSHARKGATVRQISNVVAATDLTLLSLSGIGLRHGKKLGFASCKRNSGATEGINVLLEKRNLDGRWSYGLSCIEYTEFDKHGITVGPIASSSFQPEFPANTNILYVDLRSAEIVASSKSRSSLPGMVLNVKKSISYKDQFGMNHCVSGGRLECTMQNIADSFANTFSSRCCDGVEEKLDTFIVYNERRKVTSSAKKRRKHTDKSLQQTPDGSLLDIMRNAYDLLSQSGITIPPVKGNEEYINSEPPYLIFLHPALGPLWEVKRQKFLGGSIAKGSELQLEIAEFLWRNVELDGSLIVLSKNVMGSTEISENGEPIMQYGTRCARCRLENVKVMNDGIDWTSDDNIYWKHDVKRFEALKVILHGNAEFEAKDVVIQGNHVFEVPNGHKLTITSGYSGLDIQLERIKEEVMNRGSWFWNYRIRDTHIELELVES